MATLLRKPTSLAVVPLKAPAAIGGIYALLVDTAWVLPPSCIVVDVPALIGNRLNVQGAVLMVRHTHDRCPPSQFVLTLVKSQKTASATCIPVPQSQVLLQLDSAVGNMTARIKLDAALRPGSIGPSMEA